MIFLKNDYSLGAHPRVLQALTDTNMTLTDGYGIDPFCDGAADMIREMIDCPEAYVQFLTAGTQTNQTALAAFLRPHHSVISPSTGHVCVHETGAIEATGHKINHVPTTDGKLRPEDIDAVMAEHEDEHYVKPAIIYISNSTETGLIYTKAELIALREKCLEHGLLTYIDGARLAMAMTAPENDLKLEDLPKLCDAFYIGGTKCGAMFGEALVIVKKELQEDIRWLVKQRGGMIAKGRLLGVQFQALLKDGFYFELGAHANRLAKKLADGIAAKGYEFAIPPQTNMLFPLFTKEKVKELSENVMFEGWQYPSETHAAIRLVTSWGTTEEEVDAFLELI
ncbi:MAG: aminotransferase class V-fold PLP-dependent enzyme [Firmicutes bacterium]|nr:aminotransferase class V-fold PLP-dependent enzyme [Bacillota bacterium]MBR6799385.1 aminotransferase class V-fold PLP-dependent enzyme [Bacillota bacterium]